MADSGPANQPRLPHPAATVSPSPRGIAGDIAARVTRTLQTHIALCQEACRLVERETQSLRSQQPFPAGESQATRKGLLPRLDQSYKALREARTEWLQLPVAERSRFLEISALLRQAQELSMKTLVLDRENEQAMLRRGMLPAGQLPSASRQRPHFVADLYRRSGQPLG